MLIASIFMGRWAAHGGNLWSGVWGRAQEHGWALVQLGKGRSEPDGVKTLLLPGGQAAMM